MYKILSEFALKLLLTGGSDDNKGKYLWRNLLVMLILALAMGLLRYGEVMLDVSKLQSVHNIEQPVEFLEFKLATCEAILDDVESSLQYCRTQTRHNDIGYLDSDVSTPTNQH